MPRSFGSAAKKKTRPRPPMPARMRRPRTTNRARGRIFGTEASASDRFLKSASRNRTPLFGIAGACIRDIQAGTADTNVLRSTGDWLRRSSPGVLQLVQRCRVAGLALATQSHFDQADKVPFDFSRDRCSESTNTRRRVLICSQHIIRNRSGVLPGSSSKSTSIHYRARRPESHATLFCSMRTRVRHTQENSL